MKRRENRVYLQVLAALRLGCLAGAAYVLRADQVTTPDVWRGRSEGATWSLFRHSDILWMGQRDTSPILDGKHPTIYRYL